MSYMPARELKEWAREEIQDIIKNGLKELLKHDVSDVDERDAIIKASEKAIKAIPTKSIIV